MKITKLILSSIIIGITLTACEETIVLNLTESASTIVIEGQVTDVPGYQFVKVSRTTDFYASGKTPRVTDATVAVQDNLGNIFSFVHNPSNHVDSAGFYKPEDSFVGVIGRTYKLTVLADGGTYEARDRMLSVTPILKLEYRININEQRDPTDEDRFYEVLYFVNEPQETTDYYLFKCYRNGELTFFSDTDIYISDDELIGENIEGLPLPIFFAADDDARAEVYSLSREAFVFYRDLQKLLNNDGGMFDPPASNPRSNLSNGAFGFFQVSAVTSKEITVAP